MMATSPFSPTPGLIPWGALAAPQKPAAQIQRHANIIPVSDADSCATSNSGWIIQKFGGTSVGKFPRTIARDIVSAGLRENRIAIVCSARSTQTKSEGTTNRLLRAARAAEKAGCDDYLSIVETIREDHLAAGKSTIDSQACLDKYAEDINNECDTLIKILQSAQHLEEVSTRVEDKILSKGEKLSCLYMSALLNDNGVLAAYVDFSDLLRPLSGGNHQDTLLDEAFYARVATVMAEELNAAVTPSDPSDLRPIVPVITGYFGCIPGGLLHSVGRGYTDLCAALVAVGLHASELQIWKEVDGIFTADPRKVPTARLLGSVTPAEAAELTFYGSEVIHPFTMEQVIRARIPIRIKNVMNPRSVGTIIFPDAETVDSLHPSAKNAQRKRIVRSHQSSTNLTTFTSAALRPKRPTAITVKKDIIILNIHSNKRTRAHGFLASIYTTLDRHHLSVDLISSSEVHVSMALHSESPLVNLTDREEELAIASDDLYNAVSELRALGTIDIANNMAIISLVGKQLKNMVGISGRFLSTLGENNINIEMISQGASEINISCVISAEQADRALNVIHTSLFTFLE